MARALDLLGAYLLELRGWLELLRYVRDFSQGDLNLSYSSFL
jgi:hypothetical protein